MEVEEEVEEQAKIWQEGSGPLAVAGAGVWAWAWGPAGARAASGSGPAAGCVVAGAAVVMVELWAVLPAVGRKAKGEASISWLAGC
jgi:hypothetical protein